MSFTDNSRLDTSQVGSGGGRGGRGVAVGGGHHIQNRQDDLGIAQQDPRGADSGAVRVELQADCRAGMWPTRLSPAA